MEWRRTVFGHSHAVKGRRSSPAVLACDCRKAGTICRDSAHRVGPSSIYPVDVNPGALVRRIARLSDDHKHDLQGSVCDGVRVVASLQSRVVRARLATDRSRSEDQLQRGDAKSTRNANSVSMPPKSFASLSSLALMRLVLVSEFASSIMLAVSAYGWYRSQSGHSSDQSGSLVG